jgi:imidazoleglycerol-phosphate dehydratase
MSSPPITPEAPPAVPLDEGHSVYVRLEGGEVDTTPRHNPDAKHYKAELASESTAPARTAAIPRRTGETDITLTLDLDGAGKAEVATGVGFFDHMLTLLARHSLIDLSVQATGDLHVDAHHTVEDVGICFGKALVQAVGDKAGIRRYGSCTLPMDETLVTSAVDLSGRPFLVWKADMPLETLGTFNSQLAEEFWRAVSSCGLLTLHVVLHHGRNTHHIIEGIFKATARALREALERDPRGTGVPSTKGVL